MTAQASTGVEAREDLVEQTLVAMELPPFGEVHVPPGGELQLANLPSEVREYFDAGVELRPGDVVLDVGANVGVFAMHAASVEPSIHLVCVEPIPALHAALARNLRSNPLFAKVRVDLHRLGLTAPGEPNETEFLFFSRLPCDSTGEVAEKRRHFESFFDAKAKALRRWIGPLASIVAWLPRGQIGRRIADLVTGAERVRCSLVTAQRLMRMSNVDAIGLVKIDVEGAELKVLQGFDDWSRIRQVVLEGHDEDGRLAAVVDLLRRAGFDRIDVTRPALAMERGLTNFLVYAKRQIDIV